jgi:hypothetical protein
VFAIRTTFPRLTAITVASLPNLATSHATTSGTLGWKRPRPRGLEVAKRDDCDGNSAAMRTCPER